MRERRGYYLAKRPNSDAWCRCWFDPDTRQTRFASLGTTDRAEAEMRLARWIVEHGPARDERPNDATIDAIMVRHMTQHVLPKKIRSGNAVATSMAYWRHFYSGATLSEVTPDRQRAFAAWLRSEGKADGYIRRIVADGKSAISHAWKRGELASVPYIDLSVAPEGEARDRILSLEEMAALWNAIESPHLRIYVLLSLGTMARPEAITDLTTRAVDWNSGTINLLPTGKKQNKKFRPIIPIVDTLKPMLKAIPPGHLVTYRGRGIANIGTTFDKAVKRAGLAGTHVNRYTLRHTIISEAAKRSADQTQVEKFAGHTTGSKTTARYIKFSPGYLSEAARAVETYFADLEAMLGGSLLDQLPTRAFELRVSHPSRRLVERNGIEPLTSTMPS